MVGARKRFEIVAPGPHDGARCEVISVRYSPRTGRRILVVRTETGHVVDLLPCELREIARGESVCA